MNRAENIDIDILARLGHVEALRWLTWDWGQRRDVIGCKKSLGESKCGRLNG